MNITEIQIIGIDCATDPTNVGIATGHIEADTVQIETARCCERLENVAKLVAGMIKRPTILALDAPLGWPTLLGETLAKHNAGEPLPRDAHTLFRRDTDRYVKQIVKKQSLDVGA